MCLVSAREKVDYDEPVRVRRVHRHRHHRDYSASPPRSVRPASRHSESYSRSERKVEERAPSRHTSRPPTLKASSIVLPDAPAAPPPPSVSGLRAGEPSIRVTSSRHSSRGPSRVGSRVPTARGGVNVRETRTSHWVEVEREPDTPPRSPSPPPRDPTPPPPESSSSSEVIEEADEVRSKTSRATSHHTRRTSNPGTEYSMHEREYMRSRRSRPRDQYETYRYVNAPRSRPGSDYYDSPRSYRGGDYERKELVVDDGRKRTQVRW